MIYIDHLSLLTCIKVYKLILAEKRNITHYEVKVLDPIKSNLLSWLLIKGMLLLKITLTEADFFAGHLRTRKGENVFICAQNKLNDIAFEAAKQTISKSDLLRDLNEKWGISF